jgi:Rod binding domain-containing protein
MAKTGSFGIAKMVEQQLRAQVLGNPGTAPTVPGSLTSTPNIPREPELDK